MPTCLKRLQLSLLSTLLCFTICIACAQQSTPGPVIKTDKGYIKGLHESGIDVFKGIPYAEPPVNGLRFRSPQPHKAWADTLAATKFGHVAMQYTVKGIKGAEDCLTLNVYTPRADHNKRPIVVWVHGGSMTNGAGKDNDGHDFADRDSVVAVTINYRLGAFGFMYLDDVGKAYTSSGNNGLLDCVMALRWIKENISSFGGDPERVTVMGESAGAKLLAAVLVSPESKGLFQQYISESGSVQCIRDVNTAKHARERILKLLHLRKTDAEGLISIPADSLMKAQGKVCEGIGGNSFFGPVYDGHVIMGDAYQTTINKKIPPVKVLMGTNRDEARLFIATDVHLRRIDKTVLKSLFGNNYPMVYRSYLKELKTSTPSNAAVKILTQYMYQMHTYRFAKALTKAGIPVWMYRFDYTKTPFGAGHAMELPFVWHTRSAQNMNAEKLLLADNMHNSWVAFIVNGDPNIKDQPQWPTYQDDARQVMAFDVVSKVSTLKTVFNDTSFPSSVFVLKK
jgi:para-nitrobenzyl esterase